MGAQAIILITLIIYILALLGIGLWASRKINSEDDYFLAGRGLGALSAGLSYAASTSSAWVLLGFTGLVFSAGLRALWLVPGIFAGYLLTWLVIGPSLMEEAKDRKHITLIDYIIADTAAPWRRAIAITAALMVLFCFVFYIAAQVQAASNALTASFELSSTLAALIGAGVILLYCLLGGFIAASITDAIQALVMMLACIIVPLVTVMAAGGPGEIFAALTVNETDSYLSLTGGAAGFIGAGVALGLLGTGLGALGQPQLLAWIMATKDHKTRKTAAAITVGWGVIIYTGLVFMALAARAMMVESNTESLFFTLAQTYLPPVIAGIVIAAVLSAVMSTVDSLLLSSAAAVSHDMAGERIPKERAVFAGRIAIAAVAIAAVLVTLFAPKDIFSRVLFSWVALGAAFGPTVITKALGWRVKSGAILAAILAGFFTAVIAYNLSQGADAPARAMLGTIEKWGSWIIGLLILFIGKVKHDGQHT